VTPFGVEFGVFICFDIIFEVLPETLEHFGSFAHPDIAFVIDIGSDGNETWMEVYHHPEGITPAMIQQIHQIALSCGLPEQRKNELFIPLR
jgi:hypothetical protein